MRFELTTDQKDFAASLESLLAASDTAAVARSWADGDHEPGLKLWSRLAEQGLTMLADRGHPGRGGHRLRGARQARRARAVGRVGGLPARCALGREVEGIATVALPPHVPYALDADVADEVYVGGTLATAVGEHARVGRPHPAAVRGHGRRASRDREAFDLAVLATSAQLLGAGERILADSVTYVKQRKQFGREIGSYQAIKHALADVRIALDFARPLVYGAALDQISVSAAKVACSDAAYLASRTGLQVHGAIGYTAEFDLSIWITKVRALVGAWGTPTWHRARLLRELGVA